jgi:hypothetical protein
MNKRTGTVAKFVFTAGLLAVAAGRSATRKEHT